MEEEIKNWWEQAKRDLESAKHSLNSGDYYVASFLAHQSVEKALKSLYIKKFGKLIKIHDVFFLAEKLKLPNSLIEICKELNPVYTEARYPDIGENIPAEEYSEEDAINDLENAGKVLKWIEKQL